MNNSPRKVSDAIRRYLEKNPEPVSPRQLAERLGYAPWQIREAIWYLTAAAQAEITPDWKLKRLFNKNIEQVPEPA